MANPLKFYRKAIENAKERNERAEQKYLEVLKGEHSSFWAIMHKNTMTINDSKGRFHLKENALSHCYQIDGTVIDEFPIQQIPDEDLLKIDLDVHYILTDEQMKKISGRY